MKYLKEIVDEIEVQDILNTMFITLMITENCNFRCEYCDVVDFDKEHRFIEMDDLYKVLRFIDIQHPRPNLVFRFFGGEPTLHPQFKEMVETVKNHFEGRRNLDILLTTNLSKPYTYFESIPDYVIVAPSLHTDWAKNYEDWFSKVTRMNDRGMLHHAILMLKDDNHDIIKDLYTRYSPILPVIIVPIDEYLCTPDYRNFKEEFDCEVDDSEYEAFFGKEDMVGSTLMCSSGLFIDENGNLFDCWVKKNSRINVFQNPEHVIPQFHLCGEYGIECDKEIIRCSLKYYMNNLLNYKTLEFTKEELKLYNRKKVLFRCNG